MCVYQWHTHTHLRFRSLHVLVHASIEGVTNDIGVCAIIIALSWQAFLEAWKIKIGHSRYHKSLLNSTAYVVIKLRVGVPPFLEST